MRIVGYAIQCASIAMLCIALWSPLVISGDAPINICTDAIGKLSASTEEPLVTPFANLDAVKMRCVDVAYSCSGPGTSDVLDACLRFQRTGHLLNRDLLHLQQESEFNETLIQRIRRALLSARTDISGVNSRLDGMTEARPLIVSMDEFMDEICAASTLLIETDAAAVTDVCLQRQYYTHLIEVSSVCNDRTMESAYEVIMSEKMDECTKALNRLEELGSELRP